MRSSFINAAVDSSLTVTAAANAAVAAVGSAIYCENDFTTSNQVTATIPTTIVIPKTQNGCLKNDGSTS